MARMLPGFVASHSPFGGVGFVGGVGGGVVEAFLWILVSSKE